MQSIIHVIVDHIGGGALCSHLRNAVTLLIIVIKMLVKLIGNDIARDKLELLVPMFGAF